jgi:RNA recognition motif-containing protein
MNKEETKKTTTEESSEQKSAEKGDKVEETESAKNKDDAEETAEEEGTAKPEDEAAAAAADADTNKSDNDKSRRVYIGNLAWEVSWQDLKDLMKSTGHDVTRSDIMQTPDGRSKGCGIVEFATSEGAKQAVLTLNDTELMGRQIFVREDREDKGRAVGGSIGNGGGGGAPNSSGGGGGGGTRFSSGEQNQSRRVYVGNLSWDVASMDLKDHMGQAGDVQHAEVICEQNGRSKGCGIVEYATEEEAQEAINTLTQTELKGRMIFVREDRENSSSAGGTAGAGADGVAGAPSNATSVYVWNLGYETTWQELKDHMRKAGNVDQSTILTDSHGKSIGCGTVIYQKAQDATRAIRELQDSELLGRPMRLREDRMQPGGGGRGHHGGRGGGGGRGGRGRGGGRHGGNNNSHFQSKSEAGSQLFIGNLSFDTTWKELKDHFKQCGEVERADVKKHPDGKSRGFGIVRFLKAMDAEAAMAKLNGSDLQGREIEVRVDAPKYKH